MVERAAAGAAPSSPQPPEAGASGPGFTASCPSQRMEPTDTVIEPVRCRRANAMAGSCSADFEHVADLPLAARRLVAASLGAFELPVANVREDGAEVLVLDDRSL